MSALSIEPLQNQVDKPKVSMLTEHSAKALARNFGIKTPNGRVLKPDNTDFASLTSLTTPWVLKIISKDIIHKSDGGFVALNLHNQADVENAISRMAEAANKLGAAVEGFLVEEMVPKGVELVVGGFRDPSFGPLVMVGLGGVFVEVFKDISFRICPITRLDAEEMVDELMCKPILEGARGNTAIDKEALYNLLLQVGSESGMMQNKIGIAELDLNPVIASNKGIVAVDARIRLV
jgi:acyl-CoA synthetase (NDP forming)